MRRTLLVAAAALAFSGMSGRADADPLAARLKALEPRAGSFGEAYRPIYEAALPWYAAWGSNPRHAVDEWMVQPERYADELASAVEHGRNLFAEHPQALIPQAFETVLGGKEPFRANYWILLPTDFGRGGRRFPLLIGLHGTGWLGHRLSYVAEAGKTASGGRAFEVTPIDEAGPWRIDFLNAFLDRLLKTLPIDPDRVYVEGHSLGAMATWRWALDNPERFAAISPRAGIGEPFRAVRLKHVPSWVIHGADDDVVPRGFSEIMVEALEDRGAPVRYTVLKDVAHNMPDDLDEARVFDWYLNQTRSRLPAPPDPIDSLGIGADGLSAPQESPLPGGRFLVSRPFALETFQAADNAMPAPFDRLHGQGLSADAQPQIFAEASGRGVVWLAVPRSLRTAVGDFPGSVGRPGVTTVRYFFRGPLDRGLAAAAKLRRQLEATGRRAAPGCWVTPLTLARYADSFVAEYRVPLAP